jgi:hypothetical protein
MVGLDAELVAALLNLEAEETEDPATLVADGCMLCVREIDCPLLSSPL